MEIESEWGKFYYFLFPPSCERFKHEKRRSGKAFCLIFSWINCLHGYKFCVKRYRERESEWAHICKKRNKIKGVSGKRNEGVYT